MQTAQTPFNEKSQSFKSARHFWKSPDMDRVKACYSPTKML